MDTRVGTSGYHYKHWLGRYYPEGMKPADMLAWYMRDFDTVELNRPFYRLPTDKAFSDWRAAAPNGFLYAVKGSRFITHMKKLAEPEAHVALFMERALCLGDRLGPVLWQLPPRWKCNVERLSRFLHTLPPNTRHAFEMRDPSWYNNEVYSLLRRHNAAFCLYHLAGHQSPLEVTANWTYVRLHGPTEHAYQGRYDDDALAAWADRIRAWQPALHAAYVYFDNDDAAHAVDNAVALHRLLSL